MKSLQALFAAWSCVLQSARAMQGIVEAISTAETLTQAMALSQQEQTIAVVRDVAGAARDHIEGMSEVSAAVRLAVGEAANRLDSAQQGADAASLAAGRIRETIDDFIGKTAA